MLGGGGAASVARSVSVSAALVTLRARHCSVHRVTHFILSRAQGVGTVIAPFGGREK